MGSDNDLVPTRQQAILWTNDEWVTDAYASLGLNVLSWRLEYVSYQLTHWSLNKMTDILAILQMTDSNPFSCMIIYVP